MIRKCLAAILLLTLIHVASAQVTVKELKTDLNRIFVGDSVDCYLVIENKNSYPEKVTSVVFYGPVTPKIVTDVGTIPPGSTYELPFTFKADAPGKHTVEVKISTPNGSTTYYFAFVVESQLPDLILENSTIYLHEKNYLRVVVDSDFNVYIEPLFNASPKVAFGKEATFEYYPSEKEDIAFKVYFYNGRNYHEYVKRFDVEWRESRGVYFDVRVPEKVLLFEAVPIEILVSNLKNEPIYNLKLVAVGKNVSYPVLMPGEMKNFTMFVTASRPGKSVVTVYFEYEDEKVVRKTKTIEIEVLNESVIDVCSYEFEEGSIRGEICNKGLSDVTSVIVTFDDKKTFVGKVSSGDFEVFEIPVGNETAGKLKIRWRNMAGDVLEVEKPVKRPEIQIKAKSSSGALVVASILVAAVIIAIAVLSLRRR